MTKDNNSWPNDFAKPSKGDDRILEKNEPQPAPDNSWVNTNKFKDFPDTPFMDHFARISAAMIAGLLIILIGVTLLWGITYVVMATLGIRA